ncbi:hypothetical protein GCM10022243_67010 [Saccharothrix violaceirubra]|uniref:Uncharacterized protein n=1 Tax=Saccharothrix violaceirubra TaxID=413306 RepID=A0A7W7T2R9_9PSEU|nr:hypothetical protein [Saccharothrix violaceirubra]MBB4965504.1 hypothetical protein [Saccharothrix violaceirubra]
MLDETHTQDGATPATGAPAHSALADTLADARRLLADAATALHTATPDARDVAAVITETRAVTTTLAGVVAAVMDHTTILADRHAPEIRTEILADLRALHGCLTTGALLLAPALDDLRATAADTTHEREGSR